LEVTLFEFHQDLWLWPNFMKIGKAVAEMSNFSNFQHGGRCHPCFSKIRNFNVQYVVMGQGRAITAIFSNIFTAHAQKRLFINFL